jgi:hypothetical protein
MLSSHLLAVLLFGGPFQRGYCLEENVGKKLDGGSNPELDFEVQVDMDDFQVCEIAADCEPPTDPECGYDWYAPKNMPILFSVYPILLSLSPLPLPSTSTSPLSLHPPYPPPPHYPPYTHSLENQCALWCYGGEEPPVCDDVSTFMANNGKILTCAWVKAKMNLSDLLYTLIFVS